VPIKKPIRASVSFFSGRTTESVWFLKLCLGAVECVNPSPVVAASGVRRSQRWWWCEARRQRQSRVEVLRNRRLPVYKGALPIKGLCGRATVAARHRSVLFFVNAVNTGASPNLLILNVKKSSSLMRMSCLGES
jgi:hypothetical protein